MLQFKTELSSLFINRQMTVSDYDKWREKLKIKFPVWVFIIQQDYHHFNIIKQLISSLINDWYWQSCCQFRWIFHVGNFLPSIETSEFCLKYLRKIVLELEAHYSRRKRNISTFSFHSILWLSWPMAKLDSLMNCGHESDA